jgi:ankyrin repeat protein
MEKRQLMWASAKGHLEIVKWLIANNADVNASGKFGDTALYAGFRKRHLEIVKYSLQTKQM